MDKLLVSTVGVVVIGFIYWFFFGKKETIREASDRMTIIVEGGYKPSVIRIPQGKPAKLTFIRKDKNPCLEDLYFPDYKIKTYLPLKTPITVTLPSPHPGKSGFNCGMDMYHGRIEVA